jgi:hypothetical protein
MLEMMSGVFPDKKQANERIDQGPDSKKATTRIYGMSPYSQSHDRCGVKAKLNPAPHLGINCENTLEHLRPKRTQTRCPNSHHSINFA